MKRVSEHRPLRSYGRTKARVLKPRQAQLVDVLLPHLAVPEGAIDPEALFASPPPRRAGAGGGGIAEGGAELLSECPPSQPSPARGEGYVLEIGFGGGEHLVGQAAAHPDLHFIGVEPFLNGVASCLRHIEESGVQNVRLHMGDARDLLARLPDASLDRVVILFPDPWPKTRHWKRRLIQRDFISELARVLKPDGRVRFATDWKHYAAWTLELFLQDRRFVWTAERADDWRLPWSDHIATRYQEKRLGDCAPIFLEFAR
ncbi:MAG TPA: tRNA (guanosine(46)-N7)-methyltransferase TrmB [Caulobacterales bacterium]|nr:tRNA (guanosine(46)-N7)-methyltransferase TrmB [Caulobacterales bacterium]